jgi:hypothetical protein
MKSSTAAPSFMNSGFDSTAKGCLVPALMMPRISSAVPTGTVLLVTMILRPFIALAMALAVARRYARFARPFRPWGVPTAMKTISDLLTAGVISVVKLKRRSATLRRIISSSPGS